MPRLYVEPEADADLNGAFAWYETQHPGLGNEFLAEVAYTLSLIEESPNRYPIIRGMTRRVLVRRFPYAVFYVLDPELIAVTAVMHGRRDPRRWQERR